MDQAPDSTTRQGRDRRIAAFWVALVAVSLLAAGRTACNRRQPAEKESPGTSPASTEFAAAPTFEQAAGATYRGLDVAPEVTLRDGRWDGNPAAAGAASRPSATLVRDFLLTGDVDGDDSGDAVVLLATSSGGSGTFNYVAVVSARAGTIENVGTAALGDRVQVVRARLAARRIELDVVQAGPNDARCCPSEKVTRVFALEAGELKEVSSTVTGTLSLADLGGVEWVLVSFDRDEPAPAEPRITLIVEDERISGSAACNRYTGTVEAGRAPGEILIGERIATTRRACPEEMMMLEDRYLKALAAARKYTFIATRLAVSSMDGNASRRLLFAAHPLAEAGGE